MRSPSELYSTIALPVDERGFATTLTGAPFAVAVQTFGETARLTPDQAEVEARRLRELAGEVRKLNERQAANQLRMECDAQRELDV